MTGLRGLDREDTRRHVCFDVGEVLVDETRVWATWAGLAGVSAFTLHATIGAELAAGRSHVRALERLVGPDWRDLADEHEQRLRGLHPPDLYSDAFPALQALHDAGIEVSLCGNQPARRRAQLASLGLPVQQILTSADLGAEKPDPAFFVRLLERLDRAPDQVTYVGDRLDNDVAPAAAHGLRSIWLRRGPWALLPPRPHGIRADAVCDSLAEVVEVVLSPRAREPSRG